MLIIRHCLCSVYPIFPRACGILQSYAYHQFMPRAYAANQRKPNEDGRNRLRGDPFRVILDFASQLYVITTDAGLANKEKVC